MDPRRVEALTKALSVVVAVGAVVFFAFAYKGMYDQARGVWSTYDEARQVSSSATTITQLQISVALALLAGLLWLGPDLASVSQFTRASMVVSGVLTLAGVAALRPLTGLAFLVLLGIVTPVALVVWSWRHLPSMVRTLRASTQRPADSVSVLGGSNSALAETDESQDAEGSQDAKGSRFLNGPSLLSGLIGMLFVLGTLGVALHRNDRLGFVAAGFLPTAVGLLVVRLSPLCPRSIDGAMTLVVVVDVVSLVLVAAWGLLTGKDVVVFGMWLSLAYGVILVAEVAFYAWLRHRWAGLEMESHASDGSTTALTSSMAAGPVDRARSSGDRDHLHRKAVGPRLSVFCPHCGAENLTQAGSCVLCGRELA